MADLQLTTPVALLIFNRPDTTARVFEAIRQAKPPKLLVVADGPRPNKPDDIEKCKAARAIVEGVDWDCEVLTNYSDVNLGVDERVPSGLNWVFNVVDKAIIFEDDCLPHPTFFPFCQELLNYYQHDERVFHISGNNFQFGNRRTEYSYYFSYYNLCWGWATWDRAWQHYDHNLTMWPDIRDKKYLKHILNKSRSYGFWTKLFDDMYYRRITYGGWDYRWIFSSWSQNGLSVTPSINLVTNIGWRQDATHTFNPESHLSRVPVQRVNFPLKHPPYIMPNSQADDYTYEIYFHCPLHQRIVSKVKRETKKLKRKMHFNISSNSKITD
jgi:hypothetical protein